VLSVKELAYIDAARALGAPARRIMPYHVAPQCIAPLLVIVSLTLGSAIFAETALSFLGVGVPPPAPSWGNMLGGVLAEAFRPPWWLVVFPGMAITVTIMAANLLGDSLRDFLDPRLKGVLGEQVTRRRRQVGRGLGRMAPTAGWAVTAPGKRLKVGVVGCGAIAQIQHLPHLRELAGEFEIAGLCDLSPKLLATLGAEYGVPPERRFRDHNDLVRSDLHAIIVCPPGSHGAASIAAAEAGKHVLVEKPMCTTVAEAEAMVAAAEKARTVLMVAYMKRHDPAYRYAQARVREMSDVRFIQVNHLHPDNSLHLAEYR